MSPRIGKRKLEHVGEYNLNKQLGKYVIFDEMEKNYRNWVLKSLDYFAFFEKYDGVDISENTNLY